MAKKKLMVEFPGRNYSTDKPLLYYAGKVFEEKEYEVVRLGYNYKLTGDKNDIDGLIEESKPYIKKVLGNLESYIRILLLYVKYDVLHTLLEYYLELILQL